ncbi:hypothetical protein QAD02_011420 [Eretmocerus hayati]|uniref:Uncharacterized protein n=1 Tax=Eretmocerus hayati TaxID=131215 RepID=A0ACC2NZB7_9HYME|nr:hypothetical protein QAD02_011420 [Eretmocerus hayati]
MQEKIIPRITKILYIALRVAIIVGLLRKCRESTWGRCKSKHSLEGQVFIVTGANSGIGKQTVKELAKRKATVILACRNVESAIKTVEEIRACAPNAKLIPMELDLASRISIVNFASEVLKNFPQIHVLINNAGVHIPSFTPVLNENNKKTWVERKDTTRDGFEIHFGVNHLGHFLLTNLLLPRLQESRPSRVVVVSCSLFEYGHLDFDNLNGEKRDLFRRFSAKGNINMLYYHNSKLANVYFACQLAKITQNTGIRVYAACLDTAYTPFWRHIDKGRPWFLYIIAFPLAILGMRTANQAAQTVLHCSTEPSLTSVTGTMYRNCKLYKTRKPLVCQFGERLWQVSEQLSPVPALP